MPRYGECARIIHPGDRRQAALGPKYKRGPLDQTVFQASSRIVTERFGGDDRSVLAGALFKILTPDESLQIDFFGSAPTDGCSRRPLLPTWSTFELEQQRPDLPRLLQQMHAQQLPAHAPPIPMMPHPSLAGAPPNTAASILGLSGALPAQHPFSTLASKPELHRPDDVKSNSGINTAEERHVSSKPLTVKA
ncbi:hypothetical protein GWI33_011380 [Rhynchophorus ferrugineus]|uniref:Uncharacterized protein n=1 Tax=Rhynchophorus ferrugineus TaxID=354439 RepID=A0A834IWQ8_RHYFE|nr:hypothetical protein GWI33_011380 [Rhynchophorus ferrugineus]